MKFGGTSLANGEAFQRVVRIVESRLRENPLVVVSAMSGVTDNLIDTFQRAAQGETSEALRALESIFERHWKVSIALGQIAGQRMQAVIDNSRQEIIEIIGQISANRKTTAEGRDALASQGERLSASLLTIVLEAHGIAATYVDARHCIVTDETHGNAEPWMEDTWRETRAKLQPLLEIKSVPVLGGFIGATRKHVTTTLGRGSSDYSATLFGAALGAREVQIWTDVDGVMTADPDLVESASTISQISYEEASELARLGARVLHSKMIEPVTTQEIPIRILNSRAPDRSGTLICSGTKTAAGSVKAITHKTNLARIDIVSTPAFVANGFLRAIEDIFDRHGAGMHVVGRSAVGITFACEESCALPALVQDLEQVGSVEIKSGRAIVSCVGKLESFGSSENLLNVLRDINPDLNWHRTSHLSLISMMSPELVGPLVRQIHQSLFQVEPSGLGYG